LAKRKFPKIQSSTLIIIGLLGILVIVGVTNSGNIKTLVGIIFDIIDDRELIPVIDEPFTSPSSKWFKEELNVFIEDNPEIPNTTRNAVIASIFSTELTTYGGFIGWQGALDRINLNYADNTVPNKFNLVNSKLMADISIKLDSLPDVDFPNRGGLAVTSSSLGRAVEDSETFFVDITIFDADDKNEFILASIVRHEVGHALGLDHSERFNDLMSKAIIFAMKTISNHNVDTLYQLYS